MSIKALQGDPIAFRRVCSRRDFDRPRSGQQADRGRAGQGQDRQGAPGVQTMIIGNPLVADVTMLERQYVDDRDGTQLRLDQPDFRSTRLAIRSTKASDQGDGERAIGGRSARHGTGILFLQSALRPTIALGDDPKFMNDSIANVKTRATAPALTGGK